MHTLSDPDVLQCQYAKSIVLRFRAFAVSIISVGGAVIQRVWEGQLIFFPNRTLEKTHTKKQMLRHVTHAKNIQEMRYLKAEHKTSYLRDPSPGVNADGKPRTITASGVNIGGTTWPIMCAPLRKESWTLTYNYEP